MPAENDEYLPATATNKRYGVCSMTVRRWQDDPELGFPAPTYINRRRYWKLADLIEWERRCLRKPVGEIGGVAS